MNFPLIVFFICFIVCFLVKVPVGLSMMVASVFYFLLKPGPLTPLDMVANQFLCQLSVKYVMIAVPLFIFSAQIMNACKITDMIFDWACSIIGRFRGGLGQVNVLASLIFSGMSGAAYADAAGLGIMEISSMRKRGYGDEFACAITAASATIGPIFPPSIPMILYGSIASVSIGSLFLGGIIPGILLAAFLMFYVAIISKRRNYPRETVSYTFRQWLLLTLRSIPALLAPVILLAGIYTGIFTPTEAGAIAGAWALIVAFFIYRSLDLKSIWPILIDAAKTTAVVSLTLGASYSISYIVAIEKISILITNSLIGFMTSKFLFLLIINILFLALGMFVDTMVILVVFVPIVLPIATAMDINLVHFGVVLVFNMMVGLSTPPYGGLLFITSGISGVPLYGIIKEIIPLIVVMIIVLFLITYIPDLVMFIPNLAMR